ncbi:MAG: 3-hydroxypropionyl-CoA synthetase [Deltaproteobacteria bacterium DG_8]|nr:MAG: 3-hydroxypropionyl-CoA synthetase [Deltaproteobacteria bacterium DG_8]
MAEQIKTIDSVNLERRIFKVPDDLKKTTYIKGVEEYEEIYKKSIEDPDAFWAEKAEQLHWFKKWDKVQECDFENAKIEWFKGGKLNVSYNCIDRHLEKRKDKAAIIWEGEPERDSKIYTYQDLYNDVCKFANVLRKRGVKKGDRVSIYLPMIPELAIAMLACTRIGAIHSVIFGGFSAEALRDRIQDCESSILITSDGSFRAGRVIDLKKNADQALEECPSVKACIVCKRVGSELSLKEGRDFWWHEEMSASDISGDCEPEQMDAEDPLFILYTSGSTGKPKGVMHTTGGYLVYVYQTFKWIFDYKEDDIFWCTADIGWVTGHSYIVYGPLANGASSVMFEGVPSYPQYDRFWDIVEKYRVNQFYTAPTAIRAIAKEGDEWIKGKDLSSLRILGTVGEPINPEAWMWYYSKVGGGRCPIVDTWWQTETGGILISPLPGAIDVKPGSAGRPFPGVKPIVVREDGSPADVNEGGYLCIEKPWPGIMRGVYGDPERFKNTYFVQFPGKYYTGDGARIDEDGDFWLMGRLDDVINVSGHRMGTAEIESALVSHPKVAEAAVVGFPHDIKGQGIYAFVTLNSGVVRSDLLKMELVKHVRSEIGPIATPDKIHFTDGLPKTRSGKIMRRILKKIAAGAEDDLGDITTLAETKVVEELIKGRQ